MFASYIKKTVLMFSLLLWPFAFAYASVSISIQSLTPSTTIQVGTTLSFIVSTSDFSSPSYVVSDSLSGSSVSNSNIDSNGNFSWTPASSDVGSHDITVTVSDSSGNTAATDEKIIVNAAASSDQTTTSSGSGLTIVNLSPSTTVSVGIPLIFTAQASNLSSPVYSVSDLFGGSTISNLNINSSSGFFNWTPSSNQIGTHQISVYATDSSGNRYGETLQITVVDAVSSSLSISSISPDTTVAPGTNLTFQVVSPGFTSPSYSISDNYSGTTITASNIDSSGYFSWTPTTNETGIHYLSIVVRNAYGDVASTGLNITVSAPTQNQTQTTQTVQSTGTLASSYTFTTYLYPGLTSSEVTKLQTFLSQKGFFSGSATGFYGALTKAAVISFQKAHGLDQIGVVGPATRAALNALANVVSDGYKFYNYLTVGSTGQGVTELQNRLTIEGVYTGPITSRYGALTETAVEKYQGLHGIQQLGVVGPATRAMLNK